MKFIKKYAWTMWLGGGFTVFSGFSLIDWQWYAFIIPVILLVALKDLKTKEK